MSGRRSGNRIRGPQSALTDFLAANNISAAQIRDEHDQRRRQAEHDAANAGEGSSAQAAAQQVAEEEADAVEVAEAALATENKRKRKRKLDDAIEKSKMMKKAKTAKKHKKKPDSDDEDDDYDEEFGGYKKAKPMPGQLENCEICSKRFTVTPYSKEGPDGGLLCTPCGKQQTKDMEKEKKATVKKPAGRKRRQIESNRLDGILAMNRAKTLQQLCIEKIAMYHDSIESLGEMPDTLLERLGQIFSKKRVMNSKTMPLFVRPDLDTVAIHDAAYIESNDYALMFATCPSIKRSILRNACQFKDETMEYMMEKCTQLRHVQLYAANLVSNDMWQTFFKHYGGQLETVQLQWLDAAFDDDTVNVMVTHCPNLRRLKLKLCRRIGDESVKELAKLKKLEHLSLQVASIEIELSSILDLISAVGAGLHTLSLEHFLDIEDPVLEAVRTHCRQLSKLRISENDIITDAAFTALFTEWSNLPLQIGDFNSTRDVDNNNPTGPEEAIGLASSGFKALMRHSGTSLRHLDIASCRHISLSAFNDVFDGSVLYPMLEHINLSFCSAVDTRVVAGIFASCPKLKRVVAFGCFDVADVVVPRGIALIGVPKAQDAIEQIGVGVGMEEALSRMIAV